jgi:gamma-butyrobetaine dioxygenase
MNTPTETKISHKITAVEINGNELAITWGDGEHSTFHSVWLRHSLFFPSHQAADIGSEVASLPDDDDIVRPGDVRLTDEGELVITWHPDRQITRFNPAWLRDNSLEPAHRAARRREMKHWNASIQNTYPRADFAKFSVNELDRLSAFRGLLDHGFLVINNVPNQPDQIEKVAAFFGVIAVSHLPRIFDVRLDPSMKNGANSTRFLGPHVDESCRYAPSGMSMLYSIKPSLEGGETLLVDGFNIAESLKNQDSKAYELLSNVPMFYQCRSYGVNMTTFGKVISEDFDGHLSGIRFNDRVVSPLNLPNEIIKPAYSALRKFVALLNDPANTIRFKLNPGDVLVYDNHRVLHGRTWFDGTASDRHLQNCTIDRDLVHGKFRELAQQLGAPDWNQILPAGLIS